MDINQLDKFPHLFPPPGFTPFVRTGLVTVPAVAGSSDLETIQLTASMEGWVRLIGLEAGDFSVINFMVTLGTAPLRDYAGITVPLGNVSTPMSIFIFIPPNVPLVLKAISTGASPQPVRWLLSGWYYNPLNKRD
jgi:hypothetical protein